MILMTICHFNQHRVSTSVDSPSKLMPVLKVRLICRTRFYQGLYQDIDKNVQMKGCKQAQRTQAGEVMQVTVIYLALDW